MSSRVYDLYGEDSGAKSPEHFEKILIANIAYAQEHGNDFEKDFTLSMGDRFNRWGAGMFISDKQHAQVVRIYREALDKKLGNTYQYVSLKSAVDALKGKSDEVPSADIDEGNEELREIGKEMGG